MIARLTAAVALIAIALQPAPAAGITTSTAFGPPTIHLEASDTLRATRQALVQLAPGVTELALPLGEIGVGAGDVTVSAEPGDCVSLVARTSGPEGPRWIVKASREVEARLLIDYPVKGLSWGLAYAATLSVGGSLDLVATLTVTNGTGRDLQNARLVGEFARAELSLEAGESVTVEQPWLDAEFSAGEVSRVLVYDQARHGDAPIELLTISGEAPARSTALPGGNVRIYTASEAGGDFIRQTSLGYTPPSEPIELVLGATQGITVTRTLEETKEVDKRLDARNKVVLFDLLETWVLEVRNLRDEPADLHIREHHEGVWKLEQASTEVERSDAETLEFTVTIEPDQRREVTFRIRHENKQP